MSSPSNQLIQTGAINAEKSLASYATLTPAMLEQAMINHLVKDAEMTTEQATAFANKYSVVVQADTGWGGSVTVFEDRATGEPAPSIFNRFDEFVSGKLATLIGVDDLRRAVPVERFLQHINRMAGL